LQKSIKPIKIKDMKKAVNFYSTEELEALKAEVLANKRPCDIVRNYPEKWNRPTQGLYVKINDLRKEANLARVPAKQSKKVKEVKISKKVGRPRKDAVINTSKATVENGVVLPSGFVFDFAPKRAEMHSDHVRLFF
jgi:hypothetical protein